MVHTIRKRRCAKRCPFSCRVLARSSRCKLLRNTYNLKKKRMKKAAAIKRYKKAAGKGILGDILGSIIPI